jgi:hypothetical protein
MIDYNRKLDWFGAKDSETHFFVEGVCNDEGYICLIFLPKLSSFIDWCCYYTQVSYTGSLEPLVLFSDQLVIFRILCSKPI